MSKIQYDENMIVPSSLNLPDVRFYNLDGEPFKVYGIFRDGDRYYRLPRSVAETVSPGVNTMCETTAGARIRFMTDSPYVAVAVEYGFCETSAIITSLNMGGFDLYLDNKFVNSFRPQFELAGEPLYTYLNIPKRLYGEEDDGSEKRKMRLVTINMPSYSSVKKMHVGIKEGSEISHAPDYKHEKPVVFYGSSITNGAAASRPGLTYEARISRMLDTNFVNLGFGGLCKGEPEMARYIADLDMSVFVLDYDHNAKTVEHLLETHEPFFKTVREKNPDLPIILISMPEYQVDNAERFAVIKRTYDNAVASGDKNVYLICGKEFFGYDLEFTVDGVHPNDEGFLKMAERIAKELAPLL